MPPSSPGDRRHGGNWPLWQTEIDLDRLRQRSRILCESNAYARGLLANQTNYVIGKGFSYKAQAKKGIEVPDDHLARAQAVIDRFLLVNRWNAVADPRSSLALTATREREIFRRVLRDGEALIRCYPHPEHRTLLVRLVEPEQLRDPPRALRTEGWSFGIRHRMTPFEDVETPEEYHFVWQDPAARPGKQQGLGELVPAAEVLHLRGPDTDAGVKRGLPAFRWDVADSLERASKLQHHTSLGAAIRAAIAETQQFATGTQAQISSLAAGQAEYTETDPVTGRTNNVERVWPGTVRRMPMGWSKVPAETESAVPGYLAAAQGDLRQAGSSFCSPEYIVSGDASNADYSSTKEASAPFVKHGESLQEYFKPAYARVVWKALEYATETGELPAEILDAIDMQVEGPAVLHRNELEVAQANQIRVSMGWKSPQTCAMEEGLDVDLEQANREEWSERNGQPGPPLDIPGTELPVPAGAGGAPPSPFEEARQGVAECGGEGGKPGPCPTGAKDAGKGNSKAERLQAKHRDRRAAALADYQAQHRTKILGADTSDAWMLGASDIPQSHPERDAWMRKIGAAETASWDSTVPPAQAAAAWRSVAHQAATRIQELRALGPEDKDRHALLGPLRATAQHAQEHAATLANYKPPRELHPKLAAKLDAKEKAERARIGVKEAKDAAGHEHKGKGKGGGQFVKGSGGGSAAEPKKSAKPASGKKTAGALARVAEEEPSAKALRAKGAHHLVDKDIQRYAEEHNEPAFAKAVGGESFADNQPVDVAISKGGKIAHGVELKTMVDNKNNKITMKRSAMERKAAWEAEHQAPLHTVVLDDQKVYNAGGAGKHDDSHRDIYYRRGYGSFRVGTMHKVKDMAELKSLMALPDDKLPAAAQRPKGQALGKLA